MAKKQRNTPLPEINYGFRFFAGLSCGTLRDQLVLLFKIIKALAFALGLMTKAKAASYP